MFTKQDKHLVAKKLQKIAQKYNLSLKLYGDGTNFAQCTIFSGPIDFNLDSLIKIDYATTFATIDPNNYNGFSGKVLAEIKAAMSISENNYSVCIGIGSWDKLYQLVK